MYFLKQSASLKTTASVNWGIQIQRIRKAKAVASPDFLDIAIAPIKSKYSMALYLLIDKKYKLPAKICLSFVQASKNRQPNL